MDLIEPQQTVYKKTSISGILTAWVAALLGSTLWLKLYKNNVTVDSNTTIGNLIEADFGGYAKVVVAGFSAVNIDATGTAYVLSPLAVFQCNGASSNTIYGAYLSQSNGTTATATNAGAGGNYSPTFVVTAAGTGYLTAPKVHLTGATGSGATAHAVLSGTTVGSIVLDTPGDGLYTTFTVVIDGPEQLIVTSPFANGITVSLATDAIPYVQELAIPAISES